MQNPISPNFRCNFTGVPNPKNKPIFVISIQFWISRCENPKIDISRKAWPKTARVRPPGLNADCVSGRGSFFFLPSFRISRHKSLVRRWFSSAWVASARDLAVLLKSRGAMELSITFLEKIVFSSATKSSSAAVPLLLLSLSGRALMISPRCWIGWQRSWLTLWKK